MTVIRQVRTEDWSGLWPLLLAMGTDDTEPVAQARFAVLVEDPLWGIFVADSDGELIGYAAAQDRGTHLRVGDAHRMGRLHDLYVAERRRHEGVGRALVEAVTGWAATRIRHLEWQAHETRAAPFYERLGYRGDPCIQPDYPTFLIDFQSAEQ